MTRVLTLVRFQHLILTVPGQWPTVPDPISATPGDDSWKDTDIMVAEWAYNQPDNIWYYRDGNTIRIAQITAGSGDMLKIIFDPTGVNGDAFDYSNFHNTPFIPEDISDLTDILGLLFSGDYDDLVNKPTIPDVKRVSLTVVDGATPAVDCQSGTEVYATWEAATAATAPALSNMVANSVIHFAIKKTTVDDVVITFAATGYLFALEGEVAAASKDVTLDGDLDSFSSIMLTVTSHQILGDTVVTIATK